VGTRRGYKIYNCDPFGKCYSKYEGGTGIVEMLFCTSLVALVGAGEQPAFSPRRLQIINTKVCADGINDILLMSMSLAAIYYMRAQLSHLDSCSEAE
jgi:hypothetical protein